MQVMWEGLIAMPSARNLRHGRHWDPLEWSARIAERLPKGRLVKIEGAGAAASIPITHAADLRATVVDLIQGL
jgi:hypothetical protein